jgi:4-carboxymuconolactone decarboxylase
MQLDHSRHLRDADDCPVAQCGGNRSRDTVGAPLSFVVASPVVIRNGRMRWALDHIEILRRLAISDERLLDELLGTPGNEGDTPQPDRALDPRTLALVRLAALAAVGGAVSSYGSQADAATDAGATAAEMVDVLVGLVPVVGIPCVVAAAPKLALALGCDSDEALDQFR